MSSSITTLPRPAIPTDVQHFAAQKGVIRHLKPIIEFTQRAFSSSPLHISLEQDAEDERHRYIALDVEVGEMPPGDLLSRQQIWSAEINRICSSRDAVYFVLGWR